MGRALATAALGLATLFAVIGLWQAVTHELFFFAPNLAVSNANTDYFRVTSLFGDPSLYGRHVVLGIGVLLACLAARRIRVWPGIALLVVLWAGLFFSYSQSSMAALILITLAIAFAAGDRAVRRAVVGVALVAALAAGGYVAAQVVTGGLAQPDHERPHAARGGHRARDRRAAGARAWASAGSRGRAARPWAATGRRPPSCRTRRR